MIVGVLTTCHTHTVEVGVYVFFYLIEQHSKFLFHTLQVLYMCTLCDFTNINTHLKCIVYDMLKPRQSLRITLYKFK